MKLLLLVPAPLVPAARNAEAVKSEKLMSGQKIRYLMGNIYCLSATRNKVPHRSGENLLNPWKSPLEIHDGHL